MEHDLGETLYDSDREDSAGVRSSYLGIPLHIFSRKTVSVVLDQRYVDGQAFHIFKILVFGENISQPRRHPFAQHARRKLYDAQQHFEYVVRRRIPSISRFQARRIRIFILIEDL
jgi:hypothetical protein